MAIPKERIKHLVDEDFDFTNPTYVTCPLILREGVPVINRGTLNAVVGPKKCFKSFLVGALMSAALGGKPEECLGFYSDDGSNLKVLAIDTELDRATLSERFNLILRSAGLPENSTDKRLRVKYWLPASPQERREALQEVIERYHPDLVVLDGVADFVDDINNSAECSAMIGQLLRMTSDYNCAIVAVIHLNAAQNAAKKPRGHLGSILANKVNGRLDLKRAGSTVSVSATGGCRGKEFIPFALEFNAALGTVVTTVPVRRKREEKQTEVDDFFRALFVERNNAPMRHCDVQEALAEKFKVEPENKTKAARMIKNAVSRGILSKDEKSKRYCLAEHVASNEIFREEDLEAEADQEEIEDLPY